MDGHLPKAFLTEIAVRVSVEDRAAIDDLLMDYVWASDTADVEAYALTFAGDGVLIDSSGGRHEGRVAIQQYAREFFALPGGRGRVHFFQKMRMSAEAGGIRVFSFWQVVQSIAATREGKLRSVGTCDDFCVWTPEGWRFAERRIGRWNDETAPWKTGG